MSGFRSALPIPLGINRGAFVQPVGYRTLPWFRGGTDGTTVPPPPPPPPPNPQSGGSGGKWWEKERAKLILAWNPRKKKKDELEDVIEQALELVPSAPVLNEDAIEMVATALLEDTSISQLRRIKYAETLVARVERILAEIDDEEAILLALH